MRACFDTEVVMKIKKPNKKALLHFLQKPVAEIFLIAAVLNLIVDGFSRESVFRALGALFTHPVVFAYNVLIIAVTLAPALFFARRFFVLTIISLLWVIVGVTDFILLQFRTTPFTFVDITMIQSAINIWNHYLSAWQLAMIGILLLLAVIGCAVLFRKMKKQIKLPFMKAAAFFVIILASGIVATEGLVRFSVISENFGNLADAYHNYGLPYCFVSSVLNTGIPKPKKYSDEYVYHIIEAIENGTLVNAADLENNPKPGTDKEDMPGSSGSTPGITGTGQDNVSGTGGDSSSGTPGEGDGSGTGGSHASGAAGENDRPGTSGSSASGTTGTGDSNKPGTSGSTAGTPGTDGPDDPDQELPGTPNIIFLQLESFFDPTTILGSSFTEDPLPNFHRLMAEFTSGRLSVPSVGAGTANTEFEVITGMNLDFFGPGEYPYKTILKETTCESVGYVLKPLGYSTHAIHNNDGTFYERHKVFPNLGFDTFTSIEYMNHVERTPLNWAKDNVLVGEIAKALKSTENPDLVYAISVQGHGSYPTGPVLSEPAIDLTLPEGYSEETYYQLLYYTSQIHEMDVFVADLIARLESIGEDTILVMYGDHLPGLKLAPEQLLDGNLFQTPYVVWSNFELEPERRDLEAYQLYSYVLDRLGIRGGVINGFHQTQMTSDLYLEELEILEYDMLYGDQNAYHGENPYLPAEMRMGIDPIVLRSIRAFADSNAPKGNEKTYTVFLTGEGFTPYSVVRADGEEMPTMYVSDTILSAIMPLPAIDANIAVAQQGTDDQVLSSTEPLVITEKILSEIFPKDNPELDGED